MARIFNFSAGPAVLPEAVLQQAKDELLDWHGSTAGPALKLNTLAMLN
jgi:phosphoserine aminotransferase